MGRHRGGGGIGVRHNPAANPLRFCHAAYRLIPVAEPSRVCNRTDILSRQGATVRPQSRQCPSKKKLKGEYDAEQPFLGVAAVALIAPAGAMAQETTTTIRGTVTANGAPVPGAAVTIVNVPSGTTANATTDDKGSFNAAGLRVGGPFTVTVNAPGYPSKQVTDIFTVIAQPYDLPVELSADEGGAARSSSPPRRSGVRAPSRSGRRRS